MLKAGFHHAATSTVLTRRASQPPKDNFPQSNRQHAGNQPAPELLPVFQFRLLQVTL